MAKCVCGYETEFDVKYCPKCGAKMPVQQVVDSVNYQQPQQNGYQQHGTYQQPQQNNYQQQGTYQQPQQNGYQQQGYQQPNYQQNNSYGYNDPNDHTAQFHPNDIVANKSMAILSYFGVLVLIPIFAVKNSPYVRFHANQGLVLFIASVAVSVLSYIGEIFNLIGGITLILGVALTSVSSIAGILVFVFTIMGIVNAATNRAKELPIIGKIQILK